MLLRAQSLGVLGVVLGMMCNVTQAEVLQRLFMSGEQRAELDKLRFAPPANTPEAKRTEVPEPPARISFKGVVSRQRHPPVVWLEYPASARNDPPSFDTRLVGSTIPRLEVTFLKSGKVVMLKPGQVVESQEGKISEFYETPPPLEKTK